MFYKTTTEIENAVEGRFTISVWLDSLMARLRVVKEAPGQYSYRLHYDSVKRRQISRQEARRIVDEEVKLFGPLEETITQF